MNKKIKLINTKKFNTTEFIKLLQLSYPDATCSLDFDTPFELVVAVMLSAQCTDERVNQVTPTIFKDYSTPKDFANIDINLLESLVHSCNFYKNKARNIKKCANEIIDKFNGIVPQNIDELMSLSGIGRKSANVIMLEVFNKPVGIAVDTHVKRISNRIGLSDKTEPTKIEQDLLKLFPKEYYKDINHLFIWHGRNTCSAKKYNCDICPINKYCMKNL